MESPALNAEEKKKFGDIRYVRAGKPDEYWKDTSDNAIIRSFIDYVGASLFF